MADRVLVVDDDPDVSLFVEITLRDAGFEVILASDGSEGLRRAREGAPDAVVLDMMMPGMDGLEVLEHLRADARTHSLPVVVLTARATPADRVVGLSAGADDYLVKPFDPSELVARVQGLLARNREMRAMSPLTGLPGNVQILEHLRRLVEAGRPFAMLYVDLDNFKAYNDRYGFLRGDAAIQRVAQIVRDATTACAGDRGFVGHIGGDDLVAVCPPEVAERLADSITRRVDEAVPSLYDREDRERGSIEVVDRRGEMQRFPLLSVSIGVATSHRRPFTHPGEVVTVATEMKEYAKRITGSSWAVDRRRVDVPDPAGDRSE